MNDKSISDLLLDLTTRMHRLRMVFHALEAQLGDLEQLRIELERKLGERTNAVSKSEATAPDAWGRIREHQARER